MTATLATIATDGAGERFSGAGVLSIILEPGQTSIIKNVPRHKRGISMVLQNYALFPRCPKSNLGLVDFDISRSARETQAKKPLVTAAQLFMLHSIRLQAAFRAK